MQKHDYFELSEAFMIGFNEAKRHALTYEFVEEFLVHAGLSLEQVEAAVESALSEWDI